MKAALQKNGRLGGPVAADSAGQGASVTFLKMFLADSKFFWTEYHFGTVNIILHLVSFSFLFYGLTVCAGSA